MIEGDFAEVGVYKGLTAKRATIAGAKRVLVFRIGGLGDACVAIPAFRLIRRTFNNAYIRVLTNSFTPGVKEAPLKSVLGESGLVDGYFEYPQGMLTLRNAAKCSSELREWRPDVLVYLAPNRSRFQVLRDYVFFKYMVGVRDIVGLNFNPMFHKWNWDEKRQLFESEASRLLRNLYELGAVDLTSRAVWDLGLQPGEIKQITKILKNWEGSADYIVCMIETRRDTNNWGVDRWEKWAEMLAEEYPRLGLVLVGGSAESELSERVARHWRGPTLNLCGRANPRETAEVARQSRGFIGLDNGPTHLAAAVGTPCVAIFSARGLPGVWFPFGIQNQVIYHKTDCFGCDLVVCEKHQKKCIRSITVDEVAKATRAMLSNSAKMANTSEEFA